MACQWSVSCKAPISTRAPADAAVKALLSGSERNGSRFAKVRVAGRLMHCAKVVPLMVPSWYRRVVDINVKGLEPDVVARLSEQAATEGVSQQEWVRRVLRRTAARLSPAELLAQREAVTPMSESEFTQLQQRVSGRRRATAQRLSAGRRR